MKSTGRILARLVWLSRGLTLIAGSTVLLSVANILLNLDLHIAVSPLLEHSSLIDSNLTALIEAKEQRLAGLRTPRLAVGMATLLVWFGWLYNAARLLRLCKIGGLEFRPFMTIVWYFIPVMNLWKPLQVNIELANASKGQGDWKDSPPSRLAILTSFLGASTGLMAKAYYELSSRAETLADAIFVIRFGIALELVVIGSLVAMIGFVMRTMRDQRQLVAGVVSPDMLVV